MKFKTFYLSFMLFLSFGAKGAFAHPGHVHSDADWLGVMVDWYELDGGMVWILMAASAILLYFWSVIRVFALPEKQLAKIAEKQDRSKWIK